MATVIEATFDGAVFRPTEPVALKPNTTVRLTVEISSTPKEPTSVLDVAESLNLEGPTDWSVRLRCLD
jgi:predicted DNA-binding antitoxin AbrB/MazE fold protein